MNMNVTNQKFIDINDIDFDKKGLNYNSEALQNNPLNLPFNKETKKAFYDLFKKYDKLLKPNYELNVEDYIISKIVKGLKEKIKKNIKNDGYVRWLYIISIISYLLKILNIIYFNYTYLGKETFHFEKNASWKCWTEREIRRDYFT